MNVNSNQMPVLLKRLNRTLLWGFSLVGLALLFWSVVRVDILAREDNPRLVEAELRIQRGRILDRSEVILAETTGPPDALIRVYPHPDIGPAVGYYSFRHGTAGIEESFDSLLRGGSEDFWSFFIDQTLHRQQMGRDIRLTLDAGLQEVAAILLNNHTGAILLLAINQSASSLPAAEILALVSQPSYDPNQLDELFDDLTADQSAPLLNRVTQGQYQPGLILQPFILAAALEQGIIRLNDTVENANRPVPINGVVTRCDDQPPEPATWADVLRHHCPGPMQELADQLGVAGLDQIFADFGLTTPPLFTLDTEAPESEPMANPLLAGIGQENMTVTPLQVGLAMAALAGDGRLPQPRLVTAVQDETGAWQEVISQSANQPIRRSALPIREALPRIQNISEYSRLVLSGPEGSTNGWYLGLTADYVVVVVVEESSELTSVEGIGRRLVSTVLAVTQKDN